ncbi:MAG: NUDIX hydrolase [Prolixibacteraceae bacterium]|jgi:8-oxo-dGTP diphosphatase|nr:NUDIX hydrolase [Prolixibacteraceae bacterium]
MPYSYKYPRPAVTTDALIYSKHNNCISILLIQRGINPFKGEWALPGGFVNIDEDLSDASSRELREETGINVSTLKQFKTYGTVNRDPRGRTISVCFYAKLTSQIEPQSGDDAAQAKWFNVNHLPKLAFDHQQIILEFIAEKLTTT